MAKLISFVVSLAALASYGGEAQIAVAANFLPTAKSLKQAFEQDTGHKIELIGGSTGHHYAQIINGAPFDGFLAADAQRPQRLESQDGLGIAGSQFVYAVGELVLWSPHGEPAADLSSYSRIAIANPRLAPYGQAARQFLEYSDLWGRVELIRGENIAQAYQFVATGQVDAGLISRAQVVGEGSVLQLPREAYDTIRQVGIRLTDNPVGAQFFQFLQGEQALAMITANGYLHPKAERHDSSYLSPASAPSDWPAIWLTLRLALVATLILLVVGTPLAWWLARTEFRYKSIVEAIVALPIVLPPTVLGFYLLIAFSRSDLAFTFTGVVVASVIYSLPFVVQPIQSALASIGAGPIEAASTLRAGPWDRLMSVVLPLAKPGFLTAAILGFAHTIGEFGVVLMIGGNIPHETRVLSIALYEHVESVDYARAHRLSAGLLVISFLLLVMVYSINRKALSINFSR